MNYTSYYYYIINISYVLAEKADALVKLQENDECNNCKALIDFNIATAIFNEILKYNITYTSTKTGDIIYGEPNCYTEEEYQKLLNFLNIVLGTSYCTDITNIIK